jgi:hypothetical protein
MCSWLKECLGRHHALFSLYYDLYCRWNCVLVNRNITVGERECNNSVCKELMFLRSYVLVLTSTRVANPLAYGVGLFALALLRKYLNLPEDGFVWSRKMLQWTFFLSFLLFFWRKSPQWAKASFTRFLDHTQRRTTVGRTPLDDWSARRRDLYQTTHNTHNTQTAKLPVGFEHTISAGEWSQTYALGRAATGTGIKLSNTKKVLIDG